MYDIRFPNLVTCHLNTNDDKDDLRQYDMAKVRQTMNEGLPRTIDAISELVGSSYGSYQ